jgi:hypothetical protein
MTLSLTATRSSLVPLFHVNAAVGRTVGARELAFMVSGQVAQAILLSFGESHDGKIGSTHTHDRKTGSPTGGMDAQEESWTPKVMSLLT